MSERGSFVTEYMYCEDCFKATERHIVKSEKYLYSMVVLEGRIIAGKVGGLGPGDEFRTMEDALSDLCHDLCCTIRIVVVPDTGAPRTYRVGPGDWEYDSATTN